MMQNEQYSRVFDVTVTIVSQVAATNQATNLVALTNILSQVLYQSELHACTFVAYCIIDTVST